MVVGLEVSGPVVVGDLDTSDVVEGSSLIVTVVRVCEKETQGACFFANVAAPVAPAAAAVVASGGAVAPCCC